MTEPMTADVSSSRAAEPPTITAVRERPILFSGEMVRAILDGRKSQTRRVLKPQPVVRNYSGPDKAPVGELSLRPDLLPTGPTRGMVFCLQIARGHRRMLGANNFATEFCPYGVVRDRLWVRETFAAFMHEGKDGFREYIYKADEDARPLNDDDDPTEIWDHGWSPAVRMPRRASRLTLEITNVRVERLQDISEADAIAEGCFDEKEHDGLLPTHIYRQLWDSLNAKRGYGWEVNPWVWVLEFQRVPGATVNDRR